MLVKFTSLHLLFFNAFPCWQNGTCSKYRGYPVNFESQYVVRYSVI